MIISINKREREKIIKFIKLPFEIEIKTQTKRVLQISNIYLEKKLHAKIVFILLLIFT
jgi:hypothetical protein